MAELIDGLYLNKFVAPQLLKEFKNYNDKFLVALEPAPEGAIAADGLRQNKLINNVGFYVNNTAPFTAKSMSGKNNIIPWDKLDTDPTKVTDAEVRALAFDKRAEVRVKHSQGFRIGIRDYVMNKLAPAENVSGAMPVLRTTGAVFNGRKRLTFQDLINFYNEIETLNLIDDDTSESPNFWNMILNSEHRSDLKIDKAGTANHRDNLEFDKDTGEFKRFYKMRMWENNAAPLYSATGELKARGAIREDGDQYASTFFYTPNTVYHLEKLKILYKPEYQDTTNADPTSEFRLQAYGLCDKKQEYGFGAIISDNG
ncbi:hypothetical protein OK18_02080 [Chryseobacterium gallinarum]|uniref:Major capsid protein n=1 Tax=Chryseobacterium gallinarum TaxID=1324352 RepID=A0A0G3M0T3_CHRGL|nr:hypothetical protein [Chryseobacterium gallinarum]AKK71588.1 hypothetical protein OK18_02080 [Chryseobacterium gallinarum]